MAPLDEETAKKVIRQVEFYFSDSNLPRDKFLMKTISESDDGMVILALICSFSRMRGHLGLGDMKPDDVSEETVEAVAETLRTSTFLKVSEDGKKVGRITELAKPEEVIKQLDERTIAATPLEYDVKLENVESFFGQYAKVNSVRLPRHVADNRLFCGTALIEFSSEEEAASILKQTLSFAGVELELKPKKDFDAERAKQEEEVAETRPQVGSNHKAKSNTEPDYPKGLIIAFKLKKISAEGSTTQNGNHESMSDNADVFKKDGEHDKTSEETEQKVAEDATEAGKGEEKVAVDATEAGKGEEKVAVDATEAGKGEEKVAVDATDAGKGEEKVAEDATEAGKGEEKDAEDATEAGKGEEKEADANVAATEVQESEDTEKSTDITNEEDQGSPKVKPNIAACRDNKDVVLREDLKSIFQKFGTVKFIDFKFGSDAGYVRFEDAGASQKARTAAVLAQEGGLTVKNFIAILDPVTGEAEKEYWSLLRNNQEKHRDNFKSNRGRGGKHNRGGRHFGGKHSRGRENDQANRPNKVQKVGAA